MGMGYTSSISKVECNTRISLDYVFSKLIIRPIILFCRIVQPVRFMWKKDPEPDQDSVSDLQHCWSVIKFEIMSLSQGVTTHFFCILENVELLQEIVLSIPRHLENVHEFPQNKWFKVENIFISYSIMDELSNIFIIKIDEFKNGWIEHPC